MHSVDALASSASVRLDPGDERACSSIMEVGSKSFAAASRLLPPRVRRPATVVYAFCRVSDDAVDGADDPAAGLRAIRARLDSIYAGTPEDDPVDRALAFVVRHYGLPRVLFEALLDGYLWDVEKRTYEDAEALEAYCARVAGAVGAMMTVLMGVREPSVLARACDLGIAMQLTNICRDVGEDARNGRIYLPLGWLRDGGLDTEAWLAAPSLHSAIVTSIERLLAMADVLYRRAEIGVANLPRDCRASIRAAGLIYADIGRVIRHNGHDAVHRRAVTTKARKVSLLMRALASVLWKTQPSDEPALPAAQFLVDAVAHTQRRFT